MLTYLGMLGVLLILVLLLRLVRRAEKGTFAATNRDKVLDFPRRVRVLKASAGTTTHSDPAKRLKQLQEMKDSGLITDEEYEAKRTQILDAL